MKFYKNLYIGHTVKNTNKIIKQLKKNKLKLHINLILLNDETGKLEIMDSIFLHQWFYKEKDIFVIGIASDKEEAFEIVERIALECLQTCETLNFREYLFQNAKDFSTFFRE